MSEQANCHLETREESEGLLMLSTTMVAFLAVWGTGHPGWPAQVRNSLLSLDGVLTADIDHGIAAAFYDPGRVTASDLERAVAALGNDGQNRYRAVVIDQMPARQALRL